MTWTSKRTGTAAGGYNNALCFDLALEDHILFAGDTFALNETFDGGDSHWPANYGLYTGSVGCGGFLSVPEDEIILAGFGQNGGPLTVAMGTVITSGAQKTTSWQMRPRNIGIFYGGGNAPWLPGADKRPRACGRLFARRGTTSTVYAIPYQNGLWRSNDHFGTGTRIVAPSSMNQKLQSVINEPGGTRVLVATWAYQETGKEGAYLIDNAVTAGADAATVVPLTGAPATVLEWCIIGSNLYAACGWFGVYKVTGANWNTWTKISTASWPSATPGAAGEPYAVGIDGDNLAGEDWLYVTICNPPILAGDTLNTSLMRCQGANLATPGPWQTLTGDGQWSPLIWGSGETWWIGQSFSSFRPDKSFGDMENVACDPFDVNKVHMVGRAGGHQSRNSKAAAASVVLRPAVYGQSGTTTRMLLADPGRFNHIYTMNTDHKVVASATDFSPGSVKKIAPAGSGGDAGTWGDVGPDGKFYACIAKRDWYRDDLPDPGVSYGEIYRYEADPLTSTTVSLGLNTATPAHDKPAGIVVSGTAATPIVIVGLIGRGIWRKVGAGAWGSVVGSSVFSTSPVRNHLFPTTKDIDGDTVFITDPNDGIFRSLDQGATWKGPGGTPNPGPWWPIGSVISLQSDPLTSGRLFVCRTTGIYRVAAADVLGTDPATSAVRITPASGPMTAVGGMTVDRITGDILCITRPTATTVGKAFLSTNPEAGTPTWVDVSDLLFSAAAYSLNSVCTDNPNGQAFVMPGGVFLFEDDGVTDPGTPPGVGPNMGGSRFHLVRSAVP